MRIQPFNHGFTLIEVLIALAIISIAFTAIIKSASENIRSTAYLQDKTIAHWVGLHTLNEARIGLITLPLTPGRLEDKTTMLGQQWAWEAYLVPTPNTHVTEIHVSVHRQKDETPIVQLTGYRYA